MFHKSLSFFLLCAGFVLSGVSTASAEVTQTTKVEPFGTMPDGRIVNKYSVTNASGSSVSFMNLGATILTLEVPDRSGKMADVVLGFDTFEPYLENAPYFGTVVGRYGNRINKGQFFLGGKKVQLNTNDGPNHLHGGNKGFNKLYWSGRLIETGEGAGVRFRVTSQDGDENYPGDIHVVLDYIFTPTNELKLSYRITALDDTIANITQHSYFNLGGHNSGSVLDHLLQINADYYTPIDKTSIPTGEILKVDGTPSDFTREKPIGRDINKKHPQLKHGLGYDHNWVLKQSEFAQDLHTAVVLTDPASGRVLTLTTDLPGQQFYSGNFMDGKIIGKDDAAYSYRGAIVLETQFFPDSPNHPHFPRTRMRAGQTQVSKTVYAFSVE